MESLVQCPACGAKVPGQGFYCLQCGSALRERPISVSVGKQIFMYVISALFTPFGLAWAFKYMRRKDPTAKKIGIAIIVITIVSLVINLWILFALYDRYFQMLRDISTF